MAGVEVDATELRTFAADLLHAAGEVVAGVPGVVTRGAVNVKNQLRAEMGASRHFRGAAADIDFDLTETASGVEAEIGPHSGPGNPGALANIAYFGTSRGGGTVPDPEGALEAEVPRFESALDALLNTKGL